MTILLTLEIEGGNLGPFNLYSNTDGYTNPFATNITKSALEAGYTSTSVPPNTTTVQVKSVGNCSNTINVVLENTTTTSTTTLVPSVPCNGTDDSGGYGIRDLNVNLDPAGGVITFLFNPKGAADKMEFYHGLPQDGGTNKVATTSQSINSYILIVNASVAANAGAVYSSTSGASYTVGNTKLTGVGTSLVVTCPTSTDPITTLTRTSGTGDSSINFTSMSIVTDGGNYGPFDNVYGTPPAPIIFPDNPVTPVDQFIGTFKGTVPTRQSQYTSDTGFTIPNMIIGGITYDQVIWWKYDAADYLANPVVTVRVTGGNTGTEWDSIRICNIATTTTTTSSSSTSTSTSTSSSTTTSTTAIPTTTTTTTACVNRPVGLTNGNLINACNNSGDPSWNFGASSTEACNAFNYFRPVPGTAGSGASYIDMQYGTLAVGQIIYDNYDGTDCAKVINGIYWFQPNTTNPITYFKNINQISIVTTVSGVITAIDICDYVPPTTTTTTTL